jgi:putative ABC transport system permease protein
VGLRKVVGAARTQLLRQFLGETVLVAVISLILAIGIASLVLPVFNQLSERKLSIDFSTNYPLIIVLILLVGTVGVLAGLYPAVVLSSFKPVEVFEREI